MLRVRGPFKRIAGAARGEEMCRAKGFARFRMAPVVSRARKEPKGPNLYLVGFMGVGKSAIGRRVARELGLKFLDSDVVIEKQAGVSIAEIFARDGETAFRQMERGFIEGGHPDRGCVVACGGGLVVQPGMAERLKTLGVVVGLFASAESILERTSRNSNRPLLNVSDPESRIRELLAEREPVYMDAGICISTEGRSIPEVVRHIVRAYREHASGFPGN